MRWWRITAPHLRAVLLVRDGMVIGAEATIAEVIGKPWSEVRAALSAKGWHGEPINPNVAILHPETAR